MDASATSVDLLETTIVAEEIEHSLAALLRISDILDSSFDLQSLLDALVKQALELTGAESGCAGLRTGKGMSCNHFLHGTDRVPFIYDCGPGVGWPGHVLTDGIYYLTNDASHDSVIAPQIRERFGVKSGICVPILDAQKDVIAFFEVYNKKRGGFSPQDLKNSLAAAQIASLAIQNSLTYEKLCSLTVFSQSLALASDLEQVLDVTGHHLEVNFHRGAVILLSAETELSPRFQTPGFVTGPREHDAAVWCWKHGQEAGASTSILSEAKAHYLPLTVRSQVVGVLGLESSPDAWVPMSQRELWPDSSDNPH